MKDANRTISLTLALRPIRRPKLFIVVSVSDGFCISVGPFKLLPTPNSAIESAVRSFVLLSETWLVAAARKLLGAFHALSSDGGRLSERMERCMV
jgi:hypothetical protein